MVSVIEMDLMRYKIHFISAVYVLLTIHTLSWTVNDLQAGKMHTYSDKNDCAFASNRLY